jgi:hypothetical protein
MGLIDYAVERSFRNEKAGRVVVLSGVGKGRGYLIRSTSEEQRIRAFLRMYFFAQFSIQMLGTLLVCGWIGTLGGATDRPSLERELVRGGIFLAAYVLVVGLPFGFLWRSYKKAVVSFVSPQDEVAVARRPLDRTQWLALAALAVLMAVLAMAILLLVRPR